MELKRIKEIFTLPDNTYRGKPFWSWNGELREEELVRQSGVMKEMGLGGYFMHSRAGLITEYLGDEWFDLINAVADAAERDGMEAWLYDEDRWPSGSAGGKVTKDPQYRMKSLYVYESLPEKFEYKDDTHSVFVAKIDGLNIWYYKKLDLSCGDDAISKIDEAIEQLKSENDTHDGEWKVLRFAIVLDPCDSNYNGTTYADTLSRKATDKFIEITHDEYKKRCGDRLGHSIKGIFTDEPHRGHCFDNLSVSDGVRSCAVCWTDDILEEFEKRYGFDASKILPELFYRYKGELVAPVKLHYIDLANNLFLERFLIPINEWCENNNMILTGHALHENSLMNQTVPHGSLMRCYEYMGYPGVDTLGEHNKCYWIVKQLTSSARQIGKKWLLSELYGCTGWQFNFKSHKVVGDWQALFGINLRCPHLSWYTMEGESKRDYPASILHQSPWYKDYKFVEDYFARFGLFISEGSAECDVLMLNPIESVWCQAYIGWSRWLYNNSSDITPYEQRYAQLFHILTNNQIDFDYGEEEMMSRMARVGLDDDNKPALWVGKAKYKTVIVSNMLTIRPTTLDILKKFMSLGGKVIFAGDLPLYENAVKSDRIEQLSKHENAINVAFDENEIVAAVRANTEAFVSVNKYNGECEKEVFAQVRRDFGESGKAVALLNVNPNESKEDLVLSLRVSKGCHVQRWNAVSGERFDADAISSYEDGMIKIRFSMLPAESVFFVLTDEKEDLPKLSCYDVLDQKTIDGEFDYKLDEHNVCVLDFVKWSMNGHSVSADNEEALWADRHIRDLVGIERRGGSMLQPWYSKLNDSKCYGKLSLRYEFFVESMPKGDVYLAGERPELNNFSINGVAISSSDVNDFWIDDCFKKMKIPKDAIKLGKNEISVEVDFMRTTNVEAVYLVGDFGVKLDGNKRTLTTLCEKIGYQNYENYAMPFYTGSVIFKIDPEQYKDVLKENAEKADKIVLVPEKFTGGCVKVSALDKISVLGFDPYEADITEAYRQNAPIYVSVVGTRRNLFGPLHQSVKIANSYGPGNFVTKGNDWIDEYSLIDSGIRGIAFKALKSTDK